MSRTPLFNGSDWDFALLDRIVEAEREIFEKEFDLPYYPMQIEIVTSEQMIDSYASVGMPVGYLHWSFGKDRLIVEQKYRQGAPLAYELVINSNPCILYCMEENSATMQATVIAHAGFGHNAYYRNNQLFREWTHPGAIIDYLIFARKFIALCEERHGVSAVEAVLDACHALQPYSVDRYKHPPELSPREEEERARKKSEEAEKHVNILWENPPKKSDDGTKDERFPHEPEENLLYFIEKYAPELPPWKREIIRIVRKIGQYFYPQRLTKMMNEGFASFVHYHVMDQLYEKGLLSEGARQEFLIAHTNLIFQPTHDETRKIKVRNPKTGEESERQVSIYSGINPYALGFKLFTEIKRVCENPTEEDKQWFPFMAGTPWKKAVAQAVSDFKDESGIQQFLSPQAIRDFRLFSVLEEAGKEYREVTAIHQPLGYERVRSALAHMNDANLQIPYIEVTDVAVHGDRTLTLCHRPFNSRPLDKKDAQRVLVYVESLWEFRVKLETIDKDGKSIVLSSDVAVS